MKRRRNEAELRAVVAEVSNRDVSKLDLGDDLVEALDLDSLAGLRLLAAVEQRFGVRFPDDQLSDLRTFRRLLDALEAAPKEEPS
jgi:acyl carrier protein